MPPTRTAPESASYSLAARAAMVDLPEAVGPIIATVCPFLNENETSCRISRSVPG